MKLKALVLDRIFLMNLKHHWLEYASALTHGWKLAITIEGIFFADSPMLYSITMPGTRSLFQV